MSIYLGKNKIGITKYENLDTELTEQETMLDELEAQVNELQGVKEEPLFVTENGEYDVVLGGYRRPTETGKIIKKMQLPVTHRRVTTIRVFYIREQYRTKKKY